MPLDADDIAMFFDADMPGYAQAVIGGQAVDGLFNETAAEAFGVVAGGRITYRCADSVAVSSGATITIGAVTYSVANVVPAGAGRQLLTLVSA